MSSQIRHNAATPLLTILVGMAVLSLSKCHKSSNVNGVWGEGRCDVTRGGVVYYVVVKSNLGAKTLQDLTGDRSRSSAVDINFLNTKTGRKNKFRGFVTC